VHAAAGELLFARNFMKFSQDKIKPPIKTGAGLAVGVG
jgi:hypothetical protein